MISLDNTCKKKMAKIIVNPRMCNRKSTRIVNTLNKNDIVVHSTETTTKKNLTYFMKEQHHIPSNIKISYIKEIYLYVV
mgnify:CR=1 FL=1